MATFKDSKGREWTLTITHGDAKRLAQGPLKLNLYAVQDNQGELYVKLMHDPFLFGDVLYQLLKPQADQKQLTEEDFANALDGEASDAALEAFDEALVLFSRNPAIRSAMRRMIDKKKELTERTASRLVGKAERAFDRKTEQLTEEAERTLDSALGSGDSPTSAPGPSA
jgi:hypothetical protein